MPREELQTTVEWRQVARIDPLYVVASWPEKLGRWTPEEFYAVGRSDWEDFLHHWEHYDPGLAGTCLEIGCGAGRITHVLAERFERVVAVDVSPDMIGLARDACPENVEFVEVSGTELPRPDASVDAVFTCHVLQHLESLEHVRAYLAEASRVLRPGGSIMFQVGLHSVPMRWWGRVREELRLRRSRRARRRGVPKLDFRVRLYTREEIDGVLRCLGLADVELRVFAVRSNGAPHAFWLARKP